MIENYISHGGSIADGTHWRYESGKGWMRRIRDEWFFSRSPDFYEDRDGVKPTLTPCDENQPIAAKIDNEDAEREVFGETLDEPIPDDLWEMINN